MDRIIDKLDYLHRELAKSGIDSDTYKNLSSILIEIKSELRKENLLIPCSMQEEESMKSEWNLRKYFEQLRFDKNHHLGMGDIRLTIAQQEEICELVECFYHC